MFSWIRQAPLYLNIDSDILQSIKKHETIINEATKGQLEAKIRYTWIILLS